MFTPTSFVSVSILARFWGKTPRRLAALFVLSRRVRRCQRRCQRWCLRCLRLHASELCNIVSACDRCAPRAAAC